MYITMLIPPRVVMTDRYTVLSVNEYTPFEKYNFKQYLNEHKNHFQNVD